MYSSYLFDQEQIRGEVSSSPRKRRSAHSGEQRSHGDAVQESIAADYSLAHFFGKFCICVCHHIDAVISEAKYLKRLITGCCRKELVEQPYNCCVSKEGFKSDRCLGISPQFPSELEDLPVSLIEGYLSSDLL